MNYVYCGSYEPLFFALYLKMKGEQITVITTNENIVKYCREANIKNINYKHVNITGSTPYKIFKLKKTLKKTINRINFKKDDKFFLTGEIKIFDAFYFAKELSKKGKVYFYQTGIFYSTKVYKHSRYKPFFLRGSIQKIVIKHFLKIDLVYYGRDSSPCLGINKGFLAKHGIENYNLNMPYEQLVFEVSKNSRNGLLNCDNVIVDQGLMLLYLDSDQLIRTYKEILDLPHVFTLKEHPRLHHNASTTFFYDIFKDCDKAPKYIPLEILLFNVKNCVISVYSTVLVTASKISGLKSVSLLEMVQWHDELVKKEVKEKLMEQSDYMILFPKTVEELGEIIMKKNNLTNKERNRR